MHNSKEPLKAIGVSLLVLAIVVGAFFGLTYPYFHESAYYYQDAPVREAMAGQIDTLYCGASQAFESFMPEIIDPELGTNSYNISCNMMTMNGRLWLLKKELERNPVKTLYFEFSNVTIYRDRQKEGPEGDNFLFGRLDSFGERVSFFFSQFTPDEYSRVFFDTIKRSRRVIRLMLQNQVKPLTQWESRGFFANETNDMTVDPASLDGIYHTVDQDVEPVPDSVEILSEIMDLCQEKGIEVIFVKAPISDMKMLTYSNLEEGMAWYYETAERYGCAFYNFDLTKEREKNYPMDTAFYDGEHLSEQGAEAFSREFVQVIKAAEAGKDVSSHFFGSYAEAEQDALARIKGE